MHKRLAVVATAVLLSAANVGWPQEGSVKNPPANPSGSSGVATAPAENDELLVDQARLADRFKRLEEVLGRLAELSATTDPRRAKLLRDAIAQSREHDINVRFESIVKLLEDERLSAAAANQQDLQNELDDLLTLLLKADREKELTSQRERVRKYIKEVSRLIRLQRGIQAHTEGGDELPALGKDQSQIAGETSKLGSDIQDTEGEKNETDRPRSRSDSSERDDNRRDPDEASGPSDDSPEKPAGDNKPTDQPKAENDDESQKAPSDSDANEAKSTESKLPQSQGDEPLDSKSNDGQPSKEGKSQPSQPGESGEPSDSESQSQENSQQPEQQESPAERAAEQLRKAQQKMEDARKKLDEAERKGATEEQRQALRSLEQAKAELQRILRQLREEELERTLTQLAARFRHMLELQNAVYEGTVRLDRVPQAERDHDDEIEAARLSRQETEIVNEADKALLLLHEEGSSVAFPEAIEQIRGDMRQVAKRLSEVKPDAITQGLEQDIIAALEEVSATLDKARKDLEKKKTPPGQQMQAGEPSEPPLVDKLAELKMIRSLQVRIYQRTQRYGKMIEGEEAETPDLLEALKDLADRQQRVYQATDDLQQGKND